MSIKKQYKHQILLVSAIFIIISLFLHILSMQGQLHTIINGGDTDFMINPFLEFTKGFHAFRTESNGVLEFFPTSRILFSIPAIILNILFLGSNWGNIMYFVLLFSLSGIGMWKLLNTLGYSKWAIWIGSFYYFLNPFVITRMHTPIIHLEFAYAALPWLVFLFIRFFSSKTFPFKISFFISILFLTLSRTPHMYGLFLLLAPILAIILNSIAPTKREFKWKHLPILIIIFFLSNAMFIASSMSQFFLFIDTYSSSTIDEFYRLSLREIQSNLSIVDILGGFGNYAWNNSFTNGSSGVLGYNILATISKNLILVLSLVPIFWSITHLFKKKILLGILAVIFVFLAAGYAYPFAGMYRLIADLPLYKDMFRDSWGYWSMPYFFMLSIGLTLGTSELVMHFKNKKISTAEKLFFHGVKLLIYVFIGVQLVILTIAPGTLVQPTWFVQIPEEYYSISEYIDKELPNARVLPLPATNHTYGYTKLTWGYFGPDPLTKMASASFQDNYLSTIASEDYISLFRELLNPSKESLTAFQEVTRTPYILIHKDYDSKQYDVSAEDWKDILENMRCIQRIYENKKLELYENTCIAKSVVSISQNIPRESILYLDKKEELFNLDNMRLTSCNTNDTSSFPRTIQHSLKNACYKSSVLTPTINGKATIYIDVENEDVKVPLLKYCIWNDRIKSCVSESYVTESIELNLPIYDNDSLILFVYLHPFGSVKTEGNIKDIKIVQTKEKVSNNLEFEETSINIDNKTLENGIIKINIERSADTQYISLFTTDTEAWEIFSTNKEGIKNVSKHGDLNTVWKIQDGVEVDLTIVHIPQIAFIVGTFISFSTFIILGAISLFKKGDAGEEN